jgi:hypothetical protein
MLKIYVKFIKINEYHVLELKFKEPDPKPMVLLPYQ